MVKTHLVMLGPPGAGKGTQARQVSSAHGIPQVSTGDMLRSARSQGTELGQAAGEYMDAGELVPDEVVIGIVGERIAKPDAEDGFVLDGFPRTVAQAEALSDMGVDLEAVLNIAVSREEVVRRLGGRLNCPKCGATFHESFDQPDRKARCDECGQQLQKRADDRPAAIKERLETYHDQTAPLVGHYRQRGILVDIDGEGSPAEVNRRVEAAISDSAGGGTSNLA